MLEIRPFTENDVEAYARLRLQGLRQNPEAFGSSYEEEKDRPVEELKPRIADQPEKFTLGGWADGTLVGMVGFYRETRLKTHHKGIIWGMYVDSTMRGQGIGKQLMQAAITRARMIEGLVQIHLTVVSTNASARRLYIGLGFELYGTEPRALKVGEQYYDEDLMVLKLC